VTLTRPELTVTLDGRTLSAVEAGMVRARALLSARGAHASIELFAWPNSKWKSAAPGAPLSVSLADDEVFSGEVSELEFAGDLLAIGGLAKTVALSRSYKVQSYLGQTVADIVTDLASSGDIDEVEADAELSNYAVDDRRPIWSHLRDLARLVGAELGSGSAGGLRFVPPRSGPADHELRFGADLVEWKLGFHPPREAPRAAAYGAASEAGSEQWHWTTSAPSPVGDGDAPVSLVGAARTREVASAYQRARTDAASASERGGVLVVRGKSAIRPGELLSVSDLPSGDPGTLRAFEVEHRVDARSGFVTRLRVESAAGAALGGGLV
jgi:hypothetical protein